jgi:hypothetical protein
MRHFPAAAAGATAVAACVTLSGLLTACGSATPSAARPTVTVTVTVPPSPLATSPAAQPSPTPGGPSACSTSELSASLGRAGGAAGSSYYPIEFANDSGSACTLYGYPGVSFVTMSGSEVGAAATEDPVYPRTLVTLTPGATVHAELQVADAANYPTSACNPVAVSRIRVYAPGQTSPVYVSLTATACMNPDIPILSVQTVQPGNGNQ